MEILDEMLTSFHHTFSIFIFPEELPVLAHRIEDLPESRLVSSWDKAPRVPEGCSPDHKSIETYLIPSPLL
jgi:hypothetical protein